MASATFVISGSKARNYEAARISRARAAVGVEISDEARSEVARSRADEPWYREAAAALARAQAGTATEADWAAITPFTYGRWDKEVAAYNVRMEAGPVATRPGRQSPPIRCPPNDSPNFSEGTLVIKPLAQVVAAAVVCGVVIMPAPTYAGEADTRPCVTRGEYRDVHKGMTRMRVHRIFDTRGKRLFINPGDVTNEGREYRVCGHPRKGGSYVQVQYNNYAAGGGPLMLSFKQMHIS